MITPLDFIEHKIDWEGWPDALEWLVSDDFGDKKLNDLIAEAAGYHSLLLHARTRIESRVEELQDQQEAIS